MLDGTEVLSKSVEAGPGQGDRAARSSDSSVGASLGNTSTSAQTLQLTDYFVTPFESPASTSAPTLEPTQYLVTSSESPTSDSAPSQDLVNAQINPITAQAPTVPASFPQWRSAASLMALSNPAGPEARLLEAVHLFQGLVTKLLPAAQKEQLNSELSAFLTESLNTNPERAHQLNRKLEATQAKILSLANAISLSKSDGLDDTEISVKPLSKGALQVLSLFRGEQNVVTLVLEQDTYGWKVTDIWIGDPNLVALSKQFIALKLHSKQPLVNNRLVGSSIPAASQAEAVSYVVMRNDTSGVAEKLS